MVWANRAAPVVAEVIRRVGRDDLKALRKALSEAYPFESKIGYAYKAWLLEVRRQLGHPLKQPAVDPDDRQLDMFKE